MPQDLFAALESSGFARAIGSSLPITAWLSAFHAIGFTLVMSSGLAWNLRAAGLVLAEVPAPAIARPAARLLVTGLTVSVLTGFALFAPRASSTVANAAFQLKVVLILLAAIAQLLLTARVLSRPMSSAHSLRAIGALGLVLWLSLAVTACWFVLIE